MSDSPSDPLVPVLMSWSGGKDSCMALAEMLAGRTYDVRALVTTLTAGLDRVSMHGLRSSLLREQAASLRLPLREVAIPLGASNVQYEAALGKAFRDYQAEGVGTVGFGDLFLEDIRAYRDAFTARYGLRAVYPVWGRDTGRLAADLLAQGYRAVVVCVDGQKLSPDFVGREFDRAFLADLPPGIDPCGENGEFHTFVFDGPIFASPVRFARGERSSRDAFWFCDLLPGEGAGPSDRAALV